VTRCLAKEPGRRYQTAVDLRNDLEGLREEVTSATGMALAQAAAMNAPRPSSTISRRSPVLIAGSGVLLAMTLILWQPWSGRSGREGTSPTGTSALSGQAAAPAAERTMLAVLPFENLGPPEDAYFAGGVTQEIMSSLTSVSGLGVISRTSAQTYAGTEKTIPEIGDELGVDYVVEGSVRWQKRSAGPDRVRITPQLIRVADDTQVWTSQYDREMEDIFEIQSEIADEIAGQLGLALAGAGGQEGVHQPPTQNLQAYQAYLKAMNLWYTASKDEWPEIQAGFERALILDPAFVEAWTKLSMSHSRIYHNFYDRTEDRLIQAREAADRIFAIDPNHPKGHVALGYYYYWGRKDYQRALEEFDKTGSFLDTDTDVISAIAYINRRQVGKMEDAVEYLEKATRLNPRDPLLAHEVAYTLQCLRRFEEAEPGYDLAISLAPNEDSYYQTKSLNHFYKTGDAEKAEAVAKEAPAFTDPDWGYYLSYYLAHKGEYDEAMESALEDPVGLFEGTTRYLPMTLWAGLISWCADDDSRTRSFADSAMAHIQEKVAAQPQDARYRIALAETYALLGKRTEAVREARLATDLVPLSKDAVRAFDFMFRMAEICAMVEEKDLALDLLEELLTLPGGVSADYLKVDPWLASLRGNPRFETLVAGAS
jgi:serine/threonine-protein kinase